jgi:hypothetical protein
MRTHSLLAILDRKLLPNSPFLYGSLLPCFPSLVGATLRVDPLREGRVIETVCLYHYLTPVLPVRAALYQLRVLEIFSKKRLSYSHLLGHPLHNPLLSSALLGESARLRRVAEET